MVKQLHNYTTSNESFRGTADKVMIIIIIIIIVILFICIITITTIIMITIL